MVRNSFFTCLACACAACVTPTVKAQLTMFTITDGTADFTLNNLASAPTGTTGGIGNMRTEVSGTPVDHLFQNWFWFRNSGDTRERALSNQVFGTASGNRARLVYQEPSNDGATADALRVELEYTINDLSDGGTPNILLVIGFKIQNLTASTLNVQFFSYNDFDLNGGLAGDSAVIAGADDQTQLVHDGNARASYSTSATNHINYQIGAFPTIRTLLADADVDNLNDSGSPFGPGDYSGGSQWGTTLSAAGNIQDSLVGSVAIVITRDTCPGDTNGDGLVNVADLLQVISVWGACP